MIGLTILTAARKGIYESHIGWRVWFVWNTTGGRRASHMDIRP